MYVFLGPVYRSKSVLTYVLYGEEQESKSDFSINTRYQAAAGLFLSEGISYKYNVRGLMKRYYPLPVLIRRRAEEVILMHFVLFH